MEATDNSNPHFMLSIFLFVVAGITGFFGFSLKEIDLFMAVCLKAVSIMTGTMLGIIKLPDFIGTVKNYIKKKK